MKHIFPRLLAALFLHGCASSQSPEDSLLTTQLNLKTMTKQARDKKLVELYAPIVKLSTYDVHLPVSIEQNLKETSLMTPEKETIDTINSVEDLVNAIEGSEKGKGYNLQFNKDFLDNANEKGTGLPVTDNNIKAPAYIKIFDEDEHYRMVFYMLFSLGGPQTMGAVIREDNKDRTIYFSLPNIGKREGKTAKIIILVNKDSGKIDTICATRHGWSECVNPTYNKNLEKEKERYVFYSSIGSKGMYLSKKGINLKNLGTEANILLRVMSLGKVRSLFVADTTSNEDFYPHEFQKKYKKGYFTWDLSGDNAYLVDYKNTNGDPIDFDAFGKVKRGRKDLPADKFIVPPLLNGAEKSIERSLKIASFFKAIPQGLLLESGKTFGPTDVCGPWWKGLAKAPNETEKCVILYKKDAAKACK